MCVLRFRGQWGLGFRGHWGLGCRWWNGFYTRCGLTISGGWQHLKQRMWEGAGWRELGWGELGVQAEGMG